jgi:S-DNA-T family DNA segregation ATPase FtsK/SpoIIIE
VTVVGKTSGIFPDKFTGRGLYRMDKDNLFEFQTASVARPESGATFEFIRKLAAAEAARHKGVSAGGVPVLPEKVTSLFLAKRIDGVSPARMPVGVEKETLAVSYFNFTDSPVTVVLSTNY